jgi:hypothetical protein
MLMKLFSILTSRASLEARVEAISKNLVFVSSELRFDLSIRSRSSKLEQISYFRYDIRCLLRMAASAFSGTGIF